MPRWCGCSKRPIRCSSTIALAMRNRTIRSCRRLYAKSPPDRLELALRASPILALVLGIAHAGALVLALTLPLIIPIRLALAVILAVNLYRALALHAGRNARSAIVAVVLTGDHNECEMRL